MSRVSTRLGIVHIGFVVMSRLSGKPYSLYILWSASAHRFYVGTTQALARRLEQHNSADFASWTKRYRPRMLVFSEAHPSYAQARRRELELKAQKGGKGFFAKTGLDPSRFGRGS